MKKAVIITASRSGSNFLRSMLNSCKEFHFHGEVFHKPKVMSLRHRRWIKGDPTAVRDRDPVAFMQNVYAHAPKGLKAVGFKLFISHSPPVLDEILKDESIAAILLERKNRLASFTSMLIGRETGVHWIRPGAAAKPDAAAKPSKQIKLDFSEEDFRKHCELRDSQFGRVRQRLESRGNFFDIEYHQLSDGETITRVGDFLGWSEPANVKSDIVKQNSRSVLDRLNNPEDAMRHLASIGKEGWAEDA